MGDDLNADARATHGISRDVLEAERSKARAELADLDRDADRKLAEVAPELVRDRTKKRAELARLEEAARPRFEIQTLSEIRASGGGNWLEDPAPSLSFLFMTSEGKPYMLDSEVGLLLGPGGMGKTMALIQLAICVASDTPTLGLKPAKKGRVCLALGEEKATKMQRRIRHAVDDLAAYTRSEVMRNLAPLAFHGRSCALLGRSQGAFGPTDWFRTFRSALEASGPWRLVILDPWSRWSGPDVEEDPHAATLAVELLEDLTKLPGNPTVLVAHHTRKRSKTDRGLSSADDARGSSALVSAARWAANLDRQGDLVTLRVTKINDIPEPPPIELARGNHGVLRPATPAERAASLDAGGTKRATKGTAATATPANGRPTLPPANGRAW